jgi:hypothetical protein
VKSLTGIVALLLVLLTGCATPREVLSTPARTIIVTGFEPLVRGVNVGTTIFQNEQWESTPEGFDANEVASAFVTKTLVHPLPVIDGRTTGLALKKGGRFLFIDPNAEELSKRLVELGRIKSVDRIVLITTGEAEDWIAGTIQRLQGFGLYRREAFGLKRIQVYGVFQLRIFDCRTQTFVATETSSIPSNGTGVGRNFPWRNSGACSRPIPDC